MGHLIPHDQYDRFFRVLQRASKGASLSVQVTRRTVEHIFKCEAESPEDKDMAFAAEALRRMHKLRNIEGNVFAGDKSMPPLYQVATAHLMRKILPTMHTFGKDHGDSDTQGVHC
jgi:hypothetical protein